MFVSYFVWGNGSNHVHFFRHGNDFELQSMWCFHPSECVWLVPGTWAEE